MKMNHSARPRNRSRRISRPEAMTGLAVMAALGIPAVLLKPCPVSREPGDSGRQSQDLLDLLGEVAHAVGLGDELNIGLQLALADQGTLEVARGEQHLQRGA